MHNETKKLKQFKLNKLKKTLKKDKFQIVAILECKRTEGISFLFFFFKHSILYIK